MSTSTAEVLLRIAAAVTADGGAGVRKAIEDALQEAAPFDAGEVVFARSHGGTWRQPLGAAGPILGLDLLDHVLAHGAPYRIDDWRDAEPFAETLGLLRTRSLHSLLTVPFRFDGPGVEPLEGALTVGRKHGWAFVGASLPLLRPLASMAGLALDRTLALTTLREGPHAQGSVSPQSALAPPRINRLEAEVRERDAPTPAAETEEDAERQRAGLLAALRTATDREHERDEARAEAEALRGEAERAATALREARGQCRGQTARAEAAEARLLDTEQSRDDWAQQAALLRARCTEQEALVQSLRRGIVGARETAVGAADVAEAAQARIRELQARVSELEGGLRAAESERREREDEARRQAALAPAKDALAHHGPRSDRRTRPDRRVSPDRRARPR